MRLIRGNTRHLDGPSWGIQCIPLQPLQYPRFVLDPHPTTPNHMSHARTRSYQVHENPTRSKGDPRAHKQAPPLRSNTIARDGVRAVGKQKKTHIHFAYTLPSLVMIPASRWLTKGPKRGWPGAPGSTVRTPSVCAYSAPNHSQLPMATVFSQPIRAALRLFACTRCALLGDSLAIRPALSTRLGTIAWLAWPLAHCTSSLQICSDIR